MKAFWRNAALLAFLCFPSFCQRLSVAGKQYGDFDRYVLASPGKPDFARVNTIEIVTNEMNVACKPKRPTKLIF
ncbi:ribonuclease I [Escherichia coli]|nr:ribonuclease I [Escherichia coli]